MSQSLEAAKHDLILLRPKGYNKLRYIDEADKKLWNKWKAVKIKEKFNEYEAELEETFEKFIEDEEEVAPKSFNQEEASEVTIEEEKIIPQSLAHVSEEQEIYQIVPQSPNQEESLTQGELTVVWDSNFEDVAAEDKEKEDQVVPQLQSNLDDSLPEDEITVVWDLKKKNVELLYTRISALRRADYCSKLSNNIKQFVKKSKKRQQILSDQEIISKLTEEAVKKVEKTTNDTSIKELYENIPGNDGKKIPVLLSVYNTLKTAEEKSKLLKNAKKLIDFKYITQNIHPTSLPKNRKCEVKCNCTDGCKFSCPCVQKSIKHGKSMFYNGFVYVAEKQDSYNGCVILCGRKCGCSGKCSNGYEAAEKAFEKTEVQLNMHNPNMGFVIEARVPIHAGQLVFPFLGEISQELKNNFYEYTTFLSENDTIVKHLFKTFANGAKWNEKDIHCNPKEYGNVARFASTTEQPNLMPIRLVVNDLRPETHIFAFYAIESIPIGGELQIDYGSQYDLPKCLCDMPLCSVSKGKILEGISSQKVIKNLLQKSQEQKVEILKIEEAEKEALFQLLLYQDYNLSRDKQKKRIYRSMESMDLAVDYSHPEMIPKRLKNS